MLEGKVPGHRQEHDVALSRRLDRERLDGDGPKLGRFNRFAGAPLRPEDAKLGNTELVAAILQDAPNFFPHGARGADNPHLISRRGAHG
jgi:hypothetical protein